METGRYAGQRVFHCIDQNREYPTKHAQFEGLPAAPTVR